MKLLLLLIHAFNITSPRHGVAKRMRHSLEAMSLLLLCLIDKLARQTQNIDANGQSPKALEAEATYF